MSAQFASLRRATSLTSSASASPLWQKNTRPQWQFKRPHFFVGALIALSTIVPLGTSSAASPFIIGVATVPRALPFFVAEHEGYLAQEAPNVKIADCFPGWKCLEKMLAGAFQLSTAADTPIVRASFARSDFAVIATIASSSTDNHIVGSKAAGIFSIKQLVGKKVGVVKGSSIDYFLDSVLVFEGIDPAKVEKLDIAPEQMATALQQQKIDAFALFDPGLSKAVDILGNSVTVLKTPPIYLSTFNIIAPRASLGKNDAEITKVLRAIDKANLFIRQQPDAAQRIMYKRLKMALPTSNSVVSNIDYTLSLDQTFIKTLEGEARWFSQQKGFSGIKPANYLDLIYPTPLLQVRPQAVTIVK